MRLRVVFLVSILCCAANFAHADDASKLAKVHKFFKVAKIEQLSAQSMKQARILSSPAMIERMTGVKIPPGQQATVTKLSSKIENIVEGAMSWDKLEPEFAQPYANAFTEQQLDDLIAFYQSPTGQVLVEKNPMLLQQGSTIAQQQLQSVLPEIQQAIKDFAAQETTTVHGANPNP